MKSVEDEYYVRMKIIFEMISNWTVNVIFDVKLHLVTSVEEQIFKHDIIHNWVFYINSDLMIEAIEHRLRLSEYILYVFGQTRRPLTISRAKICPGSRSEMPSTLSI